MALPLPGPLRRARAVQRVSRVWAVVAVLGALGSPFVILPLGLPGPLAAFMVCGSVMFGWLVSTVLLREVTRQVIRRSVTTRVAWWAAVRANLLPTTAPMPPLAPAPDRVVGRLAPTSRTPRVLNVVLAAAMASLSSAFLVLVWTESGPRDAQEAVFGGVVGTAAASVWGLWNLLFAWMPPAPRPIVLEADADELWVHLREGNGWMPTATQDVTTRSFPWHDIRRATLRGSRDIARLRYLGLYLTDTRGGEFTYDLTDTDVCIGDLEAFLMERAGVRVRVEVAPDSS